MSDYKFRWWELWRVFALIPIAIYYAVYMLVWAAYVVVKKMAYKEAK